MPDLAALAGRGFNELLYGIVMVSFLAEIAFLLAPTAPPWLAAEHGLIPPVDPVLKNSLTDLGLDELAKAKGDAGLYNVVAAVPSLHAAWPMIGLLVIRKYHLPRWLFWTQLVLTVGVCFAIVYTGEHYVATSWPASPSRSAPGGSSSGRSRRGALRCRSHRQGREQHAQSARPDLEVERRREDHRLAVDRRMQVIA